MSPRAERFACVVLVALAACDEKKVTRTASAVDAASAASAGAAVVTAPVASAAPSVAAASSATKPAAASGAFDCEAGEPRRGKSIGHTSVVFKLELDNGKKAAFKPFTKKVKDRYRGEIAAYRLAMALGLSNVPPVCFRTFDSGALSTALGDLGAKLLADEAIVDRERRVKGALIPWIDGLGFWALEKEPARSDLRAWLTQKTPIPPAKVDLARQASTMIAFDFLTGNWDRYSGENVGLDKTGTEVLYIDNDAAFMVGPPAAGLARNKAMLEETDRFSRSVVTRLRALDEESLATALGEESPGDPIVPRATVALVAQRLKELVATIDRKVAAHGEAETLYFR